MIRKLIDQLIKPRSKTEAFDTRECTSSLSKRLPDTQESLQFIRDKAQTNHDEFNSGEFERVEEGGGIIAFDLNIHQLDATAMEQYTLYKAGLAMTPAPDLKENKGVLIDETLARATTPFAPAGPEAVAERLLNESDSKLTLLKE